MPRLPDAAFFAEPPDWACEILSPASGRLDRVRKMPIYARSGVACVWLVDPLIRTLEVYRLEGERWVVAATHGGEERVRVVPFDAVEVAMHRWWAET